MFGKKEVLKNLKFEDVLADESIPDNAILKCTKKEMKEFVGRIKNEMVAGKK
jgi:hypothetical protein